MAKLQEPSLYPIHINHIPHKGGYLPNPSVDIFLAHSASIMVAKSKESNEEFSRLNRAYSTVYKTLVSTVVANTDMAEFLNGGRCKIMLLYSSGRVLPGNCRL